MYVRENPGGEFLFEKKYVFTIEFAYVCLFALLVIASA